MKEVAIVGVVRTAVGRFGGTLTYMPQYQLGAMVLKEIIKRTGINSGSVDDVVMGCAYQSGYNLNCGRQAALRAGFPVEVPGCTVDRQCISGLEAISQGVMQIQTDNAEIVLAGGAENMSNLPFYLMDIRWSGLKLGAATLHDWFIDAAATVSGPQDRFGSLNMGLTAENIAQKYGISRQEQDEYALKCQEKAIEAIDQGKFKEEIVPVEAAQPKGPPIIFDTDESPRRDASLERLSKLPPIFKEGGTVTPGNSCPMNDAAAMVALMSVEKAREMGLEVMAKIRSFATVGVDPRYMGLGPVPATKKALKKAGLELKDIELIELNEAFAAQAIAVIRDFEEMGLLSQDIINVNGGGIALGHPIGCTGVRLITTLVHEMRRRGARLGLATACVGGGMGGAMIIER